MGGVKIVSKFTKNTLLVAFLRISELVMQILLYFVILLSTRALFRLDSTLNIVNILMVSGTSVTILYLTRIFLNNGILLTVIHIAVGIGIVQCGATAEEKIPYVIELIILMIHSIGLCKKEQALQAERPHIGLVSMFVIAVLAGNHTGLSQVVSISIYLGTLFIVLQVLYHNANNLNEYITRNQDIANFPVQQMISIDALLMLVLTAICGIVLMICYNDMVIQLVTEIVEAAKDAFLKLLSVIFSYKRESTPNYVPEQEPLELGIMELHSLMEDSIWTTIFQVIGYVLGVIILAIIIIGIITGSFSFLIRFIKEMRGSMQNGTDVKEFISPINLEQFFVNKKTKKDKIVGNSVNAKVRRIYKKKIMKKATITNTEIDKKMLPTQLSELYLTNNQKEITDIYEKARYSNHIVENEELVKLIKSQK